MLNCKRIFSLLLPFACAFYMLFCSKSLDVSADNTLLRTTAQQIHGLYGDTIDVSYSLGNVTHTATAQFCGSACSSGSYGTISAYYNGSNLDPNSFYSADYMDYDVIFYYVQVAAGEIIVNDISIDGLDTYFTGYARGAILGEVAGLVSGLSPDWNKISLHPDNYVNDIQAVCANYSSLPDLADYYGFVMFSWNHDISIPFRAVPYEFDNGGQITDIHFDSLCSDRYGNLIFGVVCPYYDGSITITPPPTTTTTTTTTQSNLASYDINVTVDVDLSPVVSEISGVAGEVQRVKDEVTGIATDVSNIGSLLAVDASETAANMSLEPLGTISSIDYDRILDDADEVMEDLPNALVGTASIWAMISALVDTNAIWLWLIPLCMILCFMSVMLWRS